MLSNSADLTTSILHAARCMLQNGRNSNCASEADAGQGWVVDEICIAVLRYCIDRDVPLVKIRQRQGRKRPMDGRFEGSRCEWDDWTGRDQMRRTRAASSMHQIEIPKAKTKREQWLLAGRAKTSFL